MPRNNKNNQQGANTNTSQPQGLVKWRQEQLFSQQLLRFFSDKELMAIRPVCKVARRAAERYIWSRLTTFQGMSSVISAQDLNTVTLKDMVVRQIAGVEASGDTLRITSDQITDADFFKDLLGPSLTISIKVNAGSAVPRGGVGTLPGSARQIHLQGGGKAHAKFITGGGGVLLGSPNFTPNAMSGNTVESAVAIRNPQVQAYFNRYFDLMRGGTPEETRKFKAMIEAFNNAKRPVKLALAPFVEIQPWLMAQLDGVDRIVIRMFLISNKKDGLGIVEGLNALARKNPNLEINVYVDEGQVNNTFFEYFDRGEQKKKRTYYVKEACNRLKQGAANVKVYTQTGTSGIMHDKLILAEKGVQGGQVQKQVILGSSGFSTNVMSNKNWDLMVRIDEDALYDYMMQHHQATLQSAAFNTTEFAG